MWVVFIYSSLTCEGVQASFYPVSRAVRNMALGLHTSLRGSRTATRGALVLSMQFAAIRDSGLDHLCQFIDAGLVTRLLQRLQI